MLVDGEHYRTIWRRGPEGPVMVIDQRLLPFEFATVEVTGSAQMARVIADMVVRGAGLIGAAAGYGMELAAREAAAMAGAPMTDPWEHLERAAETLKASRPTAVNLSWAVTRQLDALAGITDPEQLVAAASVEADAIADEDAEFCRQIGEHGLPILRDLQRAKGDTLNVLTHCNAGWLAFVDHGTATSPIYAAHDAGIAVHVWVDETRPRNQGARLTAWELGQHGVPHTVIVDNAGGHLMQHGEVDLVITGTDRTTYTGDVANKIGTYLKALAAHDNDVPFYVALPSSTFDWTTEDGVGGIPIEQRDGREVTHVGGVVDDGAVGSTGAPRATGASVPSGAPGENELAEVRLTPAGTPAANFAFDVTPARLVTGLITERGTCEASEAGVRSLFPERVRTGETNEK